jgi:hypothetical protein
VLESTTKVSDKIFTENQTNIWDSITFSENHVIYGILWKLCTVGQAADDNIIDHMHNACW